MDAPKPLANPANIPTKLLSPYNPQETEPRIYKLWEESGFFAPEASVKAGLIAPDAPSYTIIMPPPNVTGILHMGHALMLTIEDILIRHKRLHGFRTLYLPGTDHAAIATQARVEKDIYKAENKTRHDLGRDEFLKRVDAFAHASHDTIVSQIRVMGASCDWSREAFTLDEKRSRAVRTMFKRLYDDGLIYQGDRIVNWDPKGQTTISDDEIVYEEEKTTFYYIKYGPFTIGTARPETKFGDKYVVMHPDDARYTTYKHGQKIEVEWLGETPITATVIKDESIDMAFGTGVMTITPWHSTADFEIAERHKLDREQIIDKYGKLLPIAGPAFAGMKIKDARPKIVELLRAKGLLVKEEPYTHNIATAERTGGMVEPQIMKQWFVAVNKPFTFKNIAGPSIAGVKDGASVTFKEIMRRTVESGQIKIVPEHFSKTYFHWIDKLNDWCISRQIWYGHRIPVWYKGDVGNQEMICAIEAPEGKDYTQDPDTLDTWFSSALWTFSTLGWPDAIDPATGLPRAGSDLVLYHPTDVLETGYEILFFWVARMILMTGYALGTIPFNTIYLHGTVRDAQGRKMSKSLGNGIDPIDIAKKFGTDAGRMALIVGNTPGMDSKISEEKVRGYKNFANKLWNITRFVLESTYTVKHDAAFTAWTDVDAVLKKEFDDMIADTTKDINEYRIYMAAEKLYQYIWHRFADIIIEESKAIIKNGGDGALSRSQLLLSILLGIIKALHPFMPFVTEELWQTLREGRPEIKAATRPFLMVEQGK